MFVLLSAGFKEEDLGSCSIPPAGLNSLAGVSLPLQRGCWQRPHLHRYKHRCSSMTVVARAVVNVAATTLSPALVPIGEQEEVKYPLCRGRKHS